MFFLLLCPGVFSGSACGRFNLHLQQLQNYRVKTGHWQEKRQKKDIRKKKMPSVEYYFEWIFMPFEKNFFVKGAARFPKGY
jgi:hypothetical protein